MDPCQGKLQARCGTSSRERGVRLATKLESREVQQFPQMEGQQGMEGTGLGSILRARKS